MTIASSTKSITGYADKIAAEAVKIKDADAATKAQIAVALAKLDAARVAIGGTVAAVQPPAPSPGTATAIDYFPARPGDAPFPSPENSLSTRVGSEIQGKPYLRDKNGTIFQLTPTVVSNKSQGVTINGQLYESRYGDWYASMLMRSGDVWCQASGGQWQYFDPSRGSFYNGDMPAPVDTSAPVTPAAPPPAPTLPPQSPIQPGTSGRVLTVGTGKTYPTFIAALAAAKDGDAIDATGALIHENIPLIDKALLIKGGRYDFHDTALAQGKGGFVPVKDCIFDGIEAWGAGINEAGAGGTAAIRPGSTCHITVRNSNLHDNQNAIAGGGFPWVLNVYDTVLEHNGLGDGYTHDLYASDGIVRVTLDRVTARNPNGGHAVKIRGPLVNISNSDLAAQDATVVDLPNGSATVATITNTKLTKPAGSGNHGIVSYGVEGAKYGNVGVLIKGGSIEALCDNPFMHGAGTSIFTFEGVAVSGNKITATGAKIVGA